MVQYEILKHQSYPKKAVFAHKQTKLNQLNRIPFVKAYADVNNNLKHIQNVRNHTTKVNASLSLINLLHYSGQIKASDILLRSVEQLISVSFWTMVQFRTWSNLRGLLLLYTANSGTHRRLEGVGACLFCKQLHQFYVLLPIETARNTVHFEQSSALKNVRNCTEKKKYQNKSVV
jgi:hypothetical protein